MLPERTLLVQGLASLGLDLSEVQVDALLAYQQLIAKWNRVYNLTAVRDPQEMVSHHLLDSLAVVPPLQRWLAGRDGVRVLDVGSGAGLPGVVLALVLPRVQVTCVDTVGKKASFVQQVAAELALSNLQAVHARVEALTCLPVDVVIARAFASLPDFVKLTRQHLRPKVGVWMAMKGKRPTDELGVLPADVDVFHVEQIQVPNLAAERCIVWMRQLAPLSAGS